MTDSTEHMNKEDSYYHKPKSVWTNPVHFAAFGFGSGMLSPMPGTWGSAMAIPLYIFMTHYLSWPIYLLATIAFCFLGVWVCEKTSQDMGIHDHARIVIDEMAGMLITFFLVPVNIVWIVIGFLLFRYFDIQKPGPIKTIDDSVDGGFGIMLDDIVSGIFAFIALQIIIWIFS